MDTYNCISLIVAILALLLSGYSVMKSNRMQRYELLITSSTYEPFDGKVRVMLDIYNNSMKSVTINSMTFFSKSGQQYCPTNFDASSYYEKKRTENTSAIKSSPYFPIDLASQLSMDNLLAYPNDYEYATPTTNVTVSPYQVESFTLYFADLPPELTIRISAQQRIRAFSNTKDFSVVLVKSE